MDIRTIVEKYRNGDYNHNIKYGNKVSENYVFDEELSVKRNREMVAEHNAKVKAERDAAYAKQAELDKKLANDVRRYITEKYNISYTVATKVERFCYEYWHSNFYDYLSHIDTIADFNAGIIYSKVERVLAPALKNNKLKIAEGSITLPRVQVLPKVMFNGVTQDGVLKNICNRVITHFKAVYGKQFELTFPDVTEEGKHYIEFHFEINRKEEYKEMTISDIEKELGYKIKVVGEK